MSKQRDKHIRPINIITATDGYKLTHPAQFPKKMLAGSSYGEPRMGGRHNKVTVAGLRYVCELIAASPATQEDWDEAEEIFTERGYIATEGADWEKDGWAYIVNELDGKLPVEIKVAPEGLILPESNVIYTVDVTDENVPWLQGHIEGLILQNAWFGTTVATHHRSCMEVIHEFMEKTSDRPEKEAFMLNDFAFRGTSSYESSATGSYAASLGSNGTDTISGVLLVRHMFPEFNGLAGYTIAAREHSTTTCYGTSLDGDLKAYENSIENFGKGLYACVMDSVDYKRSVDMVADKLADRILASGGTFVARPDSGSAIDNIMYALGVLGKRFGYTYNTKGYKVLHPSVAIIQGDGLSKPKHFRAILNWMEANGWAACNVAFGMGGGLLQQLDRDWQRFAQKMCAINIDGIWEDVYKATPGKESKRGRQMLYRDLLSGEYFTARADANMNSECIVEVLFTGFLNGVCTHKQTYENATELANSWK